MKIISIDAETDGLWGNPFAAAAIVYEDEKETDKICLRLPDSFVKNQWVKENVLPTLNFPVTNHPDGALAHLGEVKAKQAAYEMFLRSFADFYMKHKDATVIWHMGHVVEAFLFREMVRFGLIGEWDAPYCPIEVSETLRKAGEKPDSVDAYAKKYNLQISDYGSTHNPLYDCEVTAKVFFHLEK